MTRKEIIKQETKKSSSWTRYVLKEFDPAREFDIPEGIRSNINWQIGHIVVSRHYHSVLSVFGRIPELMDNIPFREYARFYAMGSTPKENIDAKPRIATLLENLKAIDAKALELLETIEDEELDSAVLREHPVAKTKHESMMWSCQHQMWHNGQIAMIKKLIS